MAVEEPEIYDGSGVTLADSPPASDSRRGRQQDRLKAGVYGEVLRRLKGSACPEAASPSFDKELWAHFHRLPVRYAMDVNVERAEEVLTHKRLLNLANDPSKRPVFELRIVQASQVNDANGVDYLESKRQGEEISLSSSSYLSKLITHPPAFGSSANLEALALEDGKPHSQDGDVAILQFPRPMHEITFSTDDKPKILTQLTSMLAEVGLNIQEAHAFSTNDGFSLDVFVVTGWPYEEADQLRRELQKQISKFQNKAWTTNGLRSSSMTNNTPTAEQSISTHVQIPLDGTDVWEIDSNFLKIGNKVASGSYGDLYRGTYCSQDVAIKMFKPDCVNAEMMRQFAQEIYIMRKVRHKNVVQFIGACTTPRSLCIVTEFMSGGSIHDFLHKRKGVFKLPALLRVAIDISKGMNYLHQNNIIHRDLKAANLLMDENEVVKVADFGVARVKPQSGVMTAETGTYRWMAPEVIEHKPYDHKADVFSFSIVMWELLTGKLPYEYLTPLRAAVGVLQEGLRPTIPDHTHPKLAKLLQKCWQQDPALRPDFPEILETLQAIVKEVGSQPADKHRDKSHGGFLSALLRGH